MSEIGELLKEAFRDSEPFEPSSDRRALERAVEKYARRMRLIRRMAMLAVAFMSGVAVWSAYSFFALGEGASTRDLLLRIALFGFATVAIGWSKMWFAMMLNHVATQKELKRVQMMLLERTGGASRG